MDAKKNQLWSSRTLQATLRKLTDASRGSGRSSSKVDCSRCASKECRARGSRRTRPCRPNALLRIFRRSAFPPSSCHDESDESTTYRGSRRRGGWGRGWRGRVRCKCNMSTKKRPAAKVDVSFSAGETGTEATYWRCELVVLLVKVLVEPFPMQRPVHVIKPDLLAKQCPKVHRDAPFPTRQREARLQRPQVTRADEEG